MEVWYYIYQDNKWQKVDYDTYHSFNGRKEIRPSTWRMMLLQKYLQKYRY